jgi:hypothetical protein
MLPQVVMPEINQEITDQKPDTIVSQKSLTPEEKSDLYFKAFDLFMNDPRQLNLTQVARELKMSPAPLMRHAQNKGWEQMRLQQKSIISTVQNEKRINTAKIVDERIVEAADYAIKKATQAYLQVIDKISELPIEPSEVPEDELVKDDHGNVKSYPKRSKLIEDKVFLLNQAMDGFMKMTSGAQGIGLVLNGKIANGMGTGDEMSKLSKLNMLLVNIQSGNSEKLVQGITKSKNEILVTNEQ